MTSNRRHRIFRHTTELQTISTLKKNVSLSKPGFASPHSLHKRIGQQQPDELDYPFLVEPARSMYFSRFKQVMFRKRISEAEINLFWWTVIYSELCAQLYQYIGVAHILEQCGINSLTANFNRQSGRFQLDNADYDVNKEVAAWTPVWQNPCGYPERCYESAQSIGIDRQKSHSQMQLKGKDDH